MHPTQDVSFIVNYNETDRIMALASILQASSQVEQVAQKGTSNATIMETAIKSIFITDPKNVEEVYGSVHNLHTGLRMLRSLLERDPGVVRSDAVRYMLTLIHIERKVRRDQKMMTNIGAGIKRARIQLNHFDILHENLMANLAGIYLDTVSTMKTRIQVTGDLRNLQNPICTNKIRTALLAGLRSAILWRQVGGRRWHLVFSRASMLAEIDRLLKSGYYPQA